MTAVTSRTLPPAGPHPPFRARVAWAGLAAIVLIGLASRVVPYAPGDVSGPAYQPPSPAHLLGTDDVGQDVLSNVVAGARLSLLVGLSVSAISTTLAWGIGLLAGFASYGGALVAATDLLLALPLLPLLVLLAAYTESSTAGMIAALGALSWPAAARIVRAQVLSVRDREYVVAARALGARPLRVLVRHILPDTRPIIVSKFILTVRWAVLVQANLGFLGLGDAGAVSWGGMLSRAFRDPLLFIRPAWMWAALPPAAGVVIVVVSLGLIAQGMGDRRLSTPSPVLPGRPDRRAAGSTLPVGGRRLVSGALGEFPES